MNRYRENKQQKRPEGSPKRYVIIPPNMQHMVPVALIPLDPPCRRYFSLVFVVLLPMLFLISFLMIMEIGMNSERHEQYLTIL